MPERCLGNLLLLLLSLRSVHVVPSAVYSQAHPGLGEPQHRRLMVWLGKATGKFPTFLGLLFAQFRCYLVYSRLP